MERRPLGNTGLETSILGYGAASLGEEYGAIDLQESLAVIPAVLDAGIDFLDTSPYYGRGKSEVLLGHALRGVPRERYTLCTKLGRFDDDVFDFSPRRVRESVEVSLKRLGTDHLDIVLCHDVEYVDIDRVIQDAVPALLDLKRAGKVLAVGASGYPIPALRRMVETDQIDVILSYGCMTLHNRELQKLLPACAERGIGVINAAPFDMQLLTMNEPQPWHPAPDALREAVREAQALCREAGEDLARLAFRFTLAQPGPATTVVGTAYPREVRQWLEWLEQPVDQALLERVADLLHAAPDAVRLSGRPENNRD
jgi:aryl-alcohol dehydrogenase-like predicted oxidoreductase